MLKISTKGRYGLRALVELAVLNEKTRKKVVLKEIAKSQKISVKYLEALFFLLKSAGVIKSQRGASGGYLLAAPPEKTTILSILEVIEGPIALVDCCIEPATCENTDSCRTISLWKKLNSQLVDTLESTSLRDLM